MNLIKLAYFFGLFFENVYNWDHRNKGQIHKGENNIAYYIIYQTYF